MATEPAEASTGDAEARLGAGAERRLHPLSWLFVALGQLKSFALPLIALLVFGQRGDSWQWWGLVAVAALTLSAVLRYFTYRFRIDAGELVIRSGLLQRNIRHVPLGRIQSVALHRNLLHRLAGVAEVRLESAVGGDEPEAQMRVLSMADASALERLVERHRGAIQPAAAPSGANDGVARSPRAGQVLLRLAPLELVKLGLASQRGAVALAAGVGALMQFGEDRLWETLGIWPEALIDWVSSHTLAPAVWTAVALAVLLAASVVSKLLAVALALLRDFDFVLEQAGPRLSVERGLLTRVRASAPLRRIQHWTLRQNLLLRLFGRNSLKVETAALRAGNEEQALSELVPIAPPEMIDALLRGWLPGWSDQIPFRPLHPRAWRRLALPPCVLSLIASAALLVPFGLAGLMPLVLIPFWIVLARRQAAAAGYAISDDFLLWRSGWLDRRLSFAPIEKLQALRWEQSPFDRRHGMASLRADTAGAHPLGHRLHLVHLPEAEARALFQRLSSRLAKAPWSW